MLEKKKALKYLTIFIAIQMLALILIVYLFDPFYQYHEPYFGLKTVLFDRETQVAGSIRTLPYDSVLLGTSMMENCDSSYLDAQFNCQTLKVIKGSGSNTDLLYYLEQAHTQQDLQYVFWGLDWHALTSSTEVTVVSEYSPAYLFTANPLDDFTYHFNKDVLFKKIPLFLAYSFADINTDGHGYDWSDGKEFGAAKAMQDYNKPTEVLPAQDYTADIPLIQENISLIVEEIKSHPDTEYYILFPPYSLMMWDNVYTSGNGDKYFYMLDEIMDALLPLENAKVYYFQADRDIVCNLDNYMDKMHYTPAINQLMLESIASDNLTGYSPYRVTTDNVDEIKQNMLETYEYIITEGIYEYYEK
ncbi:MAG: hypothetical protein IJ405_08935 [Lachnospiraceae bacterium]|nr:hypothetical protein [Lachnospiraceae bacterium]